MPPPTYTVVTRQAVILGPELARGGEGAVYEVQQRADLVVKLYHPGKAPPRGKLERMLKNPPDDPTAAQGHRSIAWPCGLLHDAGGQAAGYAMPRISSGLPLHGLYNLQSRAQKAAGFHWRYLHVAARNLASAVAAIHAKGYCLGDLNESNILVQSTALLSLVDTDSFQVPNPAGPPYLCPVGKPDYTAPEIQGQDFGRLRRTEEHDRFALAVLLFQILQEGSHPFRGKGPPAELGERIRRGLFPFVPGSVAQPPPLALFGELAPPLQALFRAAFQAGHTNPRQRPSARDWGRALAQAEAGLIQCKVNPQHHYHRGLGHCTWCARTRALGGRDPFPPPVAQGRPPPSGPQVRPPPSPPPGPQVRRPPPSSPSVPQVRPLPPPRRWVGVGAGVAAGFAVLALLVLGAVSYQQWTRSTAAVLAQAREALKRGDEAAADQLFQQTLDPVLAFARDRADLYRTLADQAKPSEAALRDLALAEAKRWDALAQAQTGVPPVPQPREEKAQPSPPPAASARPGSPPAVTTAQPPADRPPAAPALPRQGPVGTIAQEMVEIPGGDFQMGCSPGDSQCVPDESPPHQVSVKPFRLGRYEVTQAQWQAVMNDNPARFKGDERPVEQVSWDDIQTFLGRLNAKGGGKPYRLPSEAEWEYAARAKTPTTYWWGKDLGKGNANCAECGSQWDNKETAPVGSFKPNAFGLYDTVGNVREWVQDCWHDSYADAPSDGSAWGSDSCTAGRVLRGGSWGFVARLVRVSYRYRDSPDYRYGRLALRLAQDL